MVIFVITGTEIRRKKLFSKKNYLRIFQNLFIWSKKPSKTLKLTKNDQIPKKKSSQAKGEIFYQITVGYFAKMS